MAPPAVAAGPRVVSTLPQSSADSALTELAIGAGQILGGSAVQFASGYGAIKVDSSYPSAGLLVGGPAATGFTVCAIGKLSPSYDAGCGWPVLGSYIGAVGGILGGGAVGVLATRNNPDPFAGLIGAGIGVVGGYVFGSPIGATTAWQIAKKPIATKAIAEAAAPVMALSHEAAPVSQQSRIPDAQTHAFVVPLLRGQF